MKPRDNPFASHRLEKLAFRMPDGLTWDAFLARCAAAKWRGAIVGPRGSGKTTLLEQLVPHLRTRGFKPHLVMINAETKLAEKETVLERVRTLRAPDLLLLDGAEQFTTRQWLTLHSAASPLAGCLITVHYTSRLPTLFETQTTPALLAELASELTGELLLDTDATALFKRHRGNVRECLRELYDQHALA
jgi:ABC-type cobalamin/Fe3+-siderophores transport system ATPase subunit